MPRDDPPIPARPAAASSDAPASSSDAATSLANPRHEAFCQHFVLLGNAAYAAIDAGYARPSSRNQGYRLMRRPAIRARIAEVRRVLARAYCLDAQVLLGKLEAVYQRANENHFFHAAARAVELQARIAGHVPSRGGERRRRVRERDQTRGPGGDREAGGAPHQSNSGRSPDRDINKTTNDDVGAPAGGQNPDPATPRPLEHARK